MPTPLTLPVFHAVRRMLRAGLRHCEIARETELSVWTIARTANDPKFQDGRHLAPRDEVPHAERADDLDLPEDDAPPDYVATSLCRCTGCGGMVYQWPCLTCQSRELSDLRARHVAQARRGRWTTNIK